MGEIAQEVPDRDPAKAYGVFSRCLIKALEGAVPSAMENRDRNGKALRVVSSQSLTAYLVDAVPLESGMIPGAEVQYPDVMPGWWRPQDVYFSAAAPAGIVVAGQLDGLDIHGFDQNRFETHIVLDRGEGPIGELQQAMSAVDAVRKQFEETVDRQSKRLAESRGRESFETRQGLTILGAKVDRVVVREGGCADLFGESGAQHVRGCGDGPQSIAIRLRSGRWIGTAMLPDFVGTITVERGLVQGLDYVPARYGRFDPPDGRGSDLLFRWSALMAHSRQVDANGLKEVANLLREGKHANPALGILAAYAFERAGDIAAVDAMIGYFAEKAQCVPYDIALLSSRPLERGPNGAIRFGDAKLPPIAGTFPLLRYGWAYLDRADAAIHPALFRLGAGLQPGLWTSLDAKQGRQLAELIEKGEL